MWITHMWLSLGLRVICLYMQHVHLPGTKCVAFFDENHSTIRCSDCELLVHIDSDATYDVPRCSRCQKYRNNLRALVSRSENVFICNYHLYICSGWGFSTIPGWVGGQCQWKTRFHKNPEGHNATQSWNKNGFENYRFVTNHNKILL